MNLGPSLWFGEFTPASPSEFPCCIQCEAQYFPARVVERIRWNPYGRPLAEGLALSGVQQVSACAIIIPKNSRNTVSVNSHSHSSPHAASGPFFVDPLDLSWTLVLPCGRKRNLTSWFSQSFQVSAQSFHCFCFPDGEVVQVAHWGSGQCVPPSRGPCSIRIPFRRAWQCHPLNWHWSPSPRPQPSTAYVIITLEQAGRFSLGRSWRLLLFKIDNRHLKIILGCHREVEHRMSSQ